MKVNSFDQMHNSTPGQGISGSLMAGVLAVILVCSVTILPALAKPDAGEALRLLQEGNARFVAGQARHPHTDAARLVQAGRENQGDHAYATVITCSDSRVPVERVFDAGVMDIFVIRVAGNVCNVDEIGSIEYGLSHVNTPVLVVLGHTQCGAVTAVTQASMGQGHALERNIPPLVAGIAPAVERARRGRNDVQAIVPDAIVENVWQSVEDLFRESPATRRLVRDGKVRVVGAVYDVATGRVGWLPEGQTMTILEKSETDPSRATSPLAARGSGERPAPEREQTGPVTVTPTMRKRFQGKPDPDTVVRQLQAGNQRFTSGRVLHPHTNAARLAQAGVENQGDHALATVIACSDSRVPVERIFDAGVMNLFIIRVAGNVCDVDENGSIEYGLAHVNTPVLVVMGHTQCGAVTAVTQATLGHGHDLERNIPPLVANIGPAVERAAHGGHHQPTIIADAIIENVWQGVEELLRESPMTRVLAAEGLVKIVGAVYDVGTGQVHWLPGDRVELLQKQYPAPGGASLQADAHATSHAPAAVHAPVSSPVLHAPVNEPAVVHRPVVDHSPAAAPQPAADEVPHHVVVPEHNAPVDHGGGHGDH